MHNDPLRCQSMLFNYETTYRTDFRDGEIKDVIKTVYKPKPVKPRPELIPLKDIQALFPLRSSDISFDMFHKPTPIIRTNPWIIQKPHKRPVDEIRLQVQQTRPEVIMTPAICLDTVEEPMRQKIIDYVYKSTQVKAMDEAVAMSAKGIDVRAPLLGEYARAKPVAIKPLNPPYVSPEWRMPSVTWDSKQLRSFTKPTKRFWLERTPNCSECKQTAARKAMQRMKRH